MDLDKMQQELAEVEIKLNQLQEQVKAIEIPTGVAERLATVRHKLLEIRKELLAKILAVKLAVNKPEFGSSVEVKPAISGSQDRIMGVFRDDSGWPVALRMTGQVDWNYPDGRVEFSSITYDDSRFTQVCQSLIRSIRNDFADKIAARKVGITPTRDQEGDLQKLLVDLSRELRAIPV